MQPGTLAVGNSTFSNNGAHGGFGGAIYGSGAVNVVNSTFTNNQDPYGFGGAIYSSGAINVSNSTFSGNGAVQGGAVLAQGTATVSNSIFTGDSSGSGSGIYGYGGTVTNVVYNGDTFSGVTVTNSVNGDPMLAPLGNYGGPTQTMLPLIGSVAICGNRTGSSVSVDQRGVATSPFRYGQSNCYDVGAVETNYGLSFTLQPTDVAVNVAMSPAPQLTMTENGTVFTLASESLLVSDRANTLTPFAVSTNSGIATLSGLVFPSAVTDKLNVSLQVRQSLATLYIASQQFQVLTAVTPSLQIAGPTTALVGCGADVYGDGGGPVGQRDSVVHRQRDVEQHGWKRCDSSCFVYVYERGCGCEDVPRDVLDGGKPDGDGDGRGELVECDFGGGSGDDAELPGDDAGG